MSERILPEFQDSLMAGKIVPDTDVAYYAYWVGRFLAFANKNQDMKLRQALYSFSIKLISYNNIIKSMLRACKRRGHYFLENVRYLLFTNKFVVCLKKGIPY